MGLKFLCKNWEFEKDVYMHRKHLPLGSCVGPKGIAKTLFRKWFQVIKAPKFYPIEIKLPEGIHRNLVLEMPFLDNKSFLKCSSRYLKKVICGVEPIIIYHLKVGYIYQ